MPEKPNTPTVTAVEGDFFGGIMEFYTKTTALLRESSLDDDKRKVVVDRIKALLDDATAEMKRTKQGNFTERLEAAYEDVKRFVDELK